MSSKINLQTCEYARKSSIFQDNQLILLKNQRNLTNHADGDSEKSKYWSYDQLCEALEELVKVI